MRGGFAVLQSIPGGLFDVGGDVHHDVAGTDGDNFVDCGDGRQSWCFECRAAFVVEDAHAGGATDDVDYVEMAGGGEEALDGGAGCFIGTDAGALWDDDLRFCEVGLGERQAKDLAAWRVFVGEEIEAVVGCDLDGGDLVFEVRDLGPVAGLIHEIVSELAAVSVGYGCDEPFSVIAGLQLNFGDAGEVFSEDVGVLVGVGAETVKINLLVEVEICLRAFGALRVAGVEEAGGVGLPGDAAAGGGEVDAGNTVGKFFAGGGFEDVGGAVFGAVLGERNGYELAVKGGDVEVHGGRTLRAGCVGVEDNFFAGWVGGSIECDEEGLLFWRLSLDGEESIAAELEVVVGDGAAAHELLETFFDGGAGGKMVEVFAGEGVFGGAPLFDFGIIPVFEPAIVVGDLYVEVLIGDGMFGGGLLGESGEGEQEGKAEGFLHRSALLPRRRQRRITCGP